MLAVAVTVVDHTRTRTPTLPNRMEIWANVAEGFSSVGGNRSDGGDGGAGGGLVTLLR